MYFFTLSPINSSKQRRSFQINQGGFTLVELLIAIVIIALLSVIGINSFIASQMKSRDSQRKSDLQQISKSLEMYYNDKGRYPDDNGAGLLQVGGANLEWNASFYDSTVTNGAIYMARLPKDPGSSSYHYVVVPPQGAGYKLYARLENIRDGGVVKDVNGDPTTYTGISCGDGECNMGVSSSNISL